MTLTGIPLQYGLYSTGRCGAQNNNHNDREITAIPRIVFNVARHRAIRR